MSGCDHKEGGIKMLDEMTKDVKKSLKEKDQPLLALSIVFTTPTGSGAMVSAMRGLPAPMLLMHAAAMANLVEESTRKTATELMLKETGIDIEKIREIMDKLGIDMGDLGEGQTPQELKSKIKDMASSLNIDLDDEDTVH